MGLAGGYNMFAEMFNSGPEIIFDNSSSEEEKTNAIAQRPPAPQGYYPHGHYHTHGYSHGNHHGHNDVGYAQPRHPQNGYTATGQRQPATNPYHQGGTITCIEFSL